MELTELNYIAGFFDGEGSICIIHNSSTSKATSKYHLRCHVANSNYDVLEWMRLDFGGSIRWNNGCYQLSLYGKYALRFLELIVPYLKLKKERADIAIKFQKARSNGGPLPLSEKIKQDEIYQTFKNSKRYWEVKL